MTITFQNVTPAPLAGVIDFSSDIWQKQCAFIPQKKYRIVAPSGKGKSTFIHYIYGLRKDYEGDVRLNSETAKTIKPDAWAMLRQSQLSIVYQDLRLFLHLTALENIQVKAALHKDLAMKKISVMAARLGVNELLHKKGYTLSYGERQRIAIIRSLVQPFNWLLLDEPFSHLDQANASLAAQLIMEEVSQRNAGMIVTSLGADDGFPYDHELRL